MDTFFKKHSLPKLIQEETESLMSPISIKDIEFTS